MSDIAEEASAEERLLHIWSKAVEEGGAFPSEPTLTGQLGISRSRLREMLIRMEERGLIRRRHGAGTVVNPGLRLLDTRLDQRVDFARVIEDAGRTPAVEVLEHGIAVLDDAEAARFGVPTGSNALRTTKRWRGDDQVLMVATDLVPLHGVTLATLPRPKVSLFEVVEAVFGCAVEWEIAVPGAAKVDRRLADWLEMVPGDACMTLDLTGVARHGRVTYSAFEHHVPGVVRSGFVRPGPSSVPRHPS